jgi:nucleoid-associated protein YgaU
MIILRKFLTAFFISVIFIFSGCALTKSDSSEVNNAASADTASADQVSQVEMLPSDSNSPQNLVDQSTNPNDVQVTNNDDKSNASTSASVTNTDVSVPSAIAANSINENQHTNSELSSQQELGEYKVQKNDTLMKIAFNIYGDIMKWKEIYNLNQDKLKNNYVLYSGMTLKYYKPATEVTFEKNGEPYLIKKGDTLGSIAFDIYGKRHYWKRLWENNKTLIKDPNKIYAGFYIYYQITEQEKEEAQKIHQKIVKSSNQNDEQKEELKFNQDQKEVKTESTTKSTKNEGVVSGLEQLTKASQRIPASAK